MDYSTRPVLLSSQRESQISRFRDWIVLVVPLAAILFQLFVPLLRIPRLHRDAAFGCHLSRPGASEPDCGPAHRRTARPSAGLAEQDIGTLGIVNTLVGYFAASVGLRIDVDHVGVRLPLTFFFYAFHQVLYWVMVRALLNKPMVFDWQRTAVLGLLNAVIGVSLFHFLKKLRSVRNPP